MAKPPAHSVPPRSGGAPGHSTIRRRRITLYFQRYPGTGRAAGIAGLDYEVSVDGGPKLKGTTGTDGAVTITMSSGSTADLSILGSTYIVTMSGGPLEAANTIQGQQRRLRALGYQIGHAGVQGDGVDGVVDMRTERSILDFQADQGIDTDAIVGPVTRGRLTTAVGA